MKPHALILVARQPLPHPSTVTIAFGEAKIEGQVTSCGGAGDRYEVCIWIPHGSEYDARRAVRVPVREEVRISPRGSNCNSVVVDVSARGVGLETSSPLEPGETIGIETSRDVAFGIVRHCRNLPGGRFRTGVEIFHIMPKNAA